MSKSCTVFCRVDEPAKTMSQVKELISNRGRLDVDGKIDDWKSIKVSGSDGHSLIINRLVFRSRGDQFTKLRYQAFMFVDSLETEHTSIKENLQARIDGTSVLFGIVAEPTLSEKGGHVDCIYGLAKCFEGIVFTGSSFNDANQKLILDLDGKTES